jgi:hypothetical protein
MDPKYGRLARAALLAAGITAAIALPAITGTPLFPAQRDASSHVALAAPAADNDNNDDPTDDNSEERNIEGTVTDIKDDQDPPLAFVGMVGGGVWARLYNDQLHNSGVAVGDYVQMQGEYSDHGVFDAYGVNVVDRCCDNDND